MSTPDKRSPAPLGAAETGLGDVDRRTADDISTLPNSGLPGKGASIRAELRRKRDVDALWRLGPAPLWHFICEVEKGADLDVTLARYAALPADFIKALGGDRFAPCLFVIDGGARMKGRVDFRTVAAAAVPALPAILARLLPGGVTEGGEYSALNPCRADRRLGSFKVNLRSGKWADFATGDKGGDVVSLVAYIEHIGQAEAARRLAHMLGLDTRGRR